MDDNPQYVHYRYNSFLAQSVLEDYAAGELQKDRAQVPILARQPIPDIPEATEANALRPTEVGAVSMVLPFIMNVQNHDYVAKSGVSIP